MWITFAASTPIFAKSKIVEKIKCLDAKSHRKIRLIEGNAKCRHLKNIPAKGLCGRSLSV
jgi:hypothetical protein